MTQTVKYPIDPILIWAQLYASGLVDTVTPPPAPPAAGPALPWILARGIEQAWYLGFLPRMTTQEVDEVPNDAIFIDGTDNYKLKLRNNSGAAAEIGAGSLLEVQDEGSAEDSNVTAINFTGAGVTASQTAPGVVAVDIPGGGSSGGGYSIPKGSLLVGDVGKMVTWDGEPKVFTQEAGIAGTPQWYEITINGDPQALDSGTLATGWFRLTANPSLGHGIGINNAYMGYNPTWGGALNIGATPQDTMIDFATWVNLSVNPAHFTAAWNAVDDRVDITAGTSLPGTIGHNITFIPNPNVPDPGHSWFFPDASPWLQLTGGIDGTTGEIVQIGSGFSFEDFVYGDDWVVAPGDNNQIAENLKTTMDARGALLEYDCGSGSNPTNYTIVRTNNVLRITADDPGNNPAGSPIFGSGESGNVFLNTNFDLGTCPIVAGAQKAVLGKLVAIDGLNAVIDSSAVLTALATEAFTSALTSLAPINGTQVRTQVGGADLSYFRALNTGVAGDTIVMFRKL